MKHLKIVFSDLFSKLFRWPKFHNIESPHGSGYHNCSRQKFMKRLNLDGMIVLPSLFRFCYVATRTFTLAFRNIRLLKGVIKRTAHLSISKISCFYFTFFDSSYDCAFRALSSISLGPYYITGSAT